MIVLVVNCGSSSIKADVLDASSGARKFVGRAERLGSTDAALTIDGTSRPCPPDHAGALSALITALPDQDLAGIGHRVVHGGEQFSQPIRIDDQVEAALEALIPLAPLHNPANLEGIRAARALFPHLVHVAVFDTAFHNTLPRRASTYALPAYQAKAMGVRRYGFHGTSHQFVAQRAAEHLRADVRDLRLITCHLGNGASVAAVEYGRSVETSMGMTPVEGLAMGSRSGDIDVGALLHWARTQGLDIDGVDHLVNRQSGLKGLTGTNDMRDIEVRAKEGDDDCQVAINVFAHRIRKYIGAYAAVMGGVDAIVFTAGIGENSALVRHRAVQRLEFLGAHLDEARNRQVTVNADNTVAEISTAFSRTRMLVVRTDEAWAIGQNVARLAGDRDRVAALKPIPVAVSARHIHLTDQSVQALFGEGHTLTPRTPLSQPGQFACEERLTIVGPKGSIDKVRVLGPTRRANQIEISRTDEFALGIDAPVRGSGDVKNTPGITLIGPAGELTVAEGVICAWRHVHMTPKDALAYGVQDKDVVEVSIDSHGGRDLIFGDVLVRVSPKYALEMHIDTDEANAADLPRLSEGMLVATTASARLTKRQTTFDVVSK